LWARRRTCLSGNLHGTGHADVHASTRLRSALLSLGTPPSGRRPPDGGTAPRGLDAWRLCRQTTAVTVVASARNGLREPGVELVIEHVIRSSLLPTLGRRSAGPVFPIGKNSSGSSPMQVARWRHVIRIRLLESKSGRSTSSESAVSQLRRRFSECHWVVQVDVKVNAKVNGKVNVQSHENCAHWQRESNGGGCRPVARRVQPQSPRPGTLGPDRGADHPQRRVPNPMGRPQRPDPHHRREAHPLPGRRDLELSFESFPLAADPSQSLTWREGPRPLECHGAGV
jgi:hypothetical protein